MNFDDKNCPIPSSVWPTPTRLFGPTVKMHKQNNDIDYVADNLTCKVVVLYIVKMFDILYIVIITALSEEGCQY